MIRFPDPVRKAAQPPLTRTERRIRTAILDAVAKIQDSSSTGEIRDALDAGNVTRAIELVRYDLGEDYLLSVLPADLRDAYETAGITAAADAVSMFGEAYSFNLITPRAVNWVSQNAGSLIQQWGASSRDALRKLLADGFDRGIGSSALARQIKTTGIGLTWRSSRAILNMRARMEADGVPADVIEKRAVRYYNRLLTDRAEMIARTEMTRAMTEARLESWRQAIDKGLLDPTRYEKEWVTTHDTRTCFPAGTLVLMGNGEQRPIEAVGPDDMVQTHLGPRSVRRTYARTHEDALVEITTSHAVVCATKDHRFVVLRNDGPLWCRADSIRHGDLLCETNGTTNTDDRGFYVALSDADNAPSVSLQPPSFPNVPRLVAVPVVSVRLQYQSWAQDQEINRVASNLGLGNEPNAQTLQFCGDPNLQSAGTKMAPVAGPGAEALSLGQRGDGSETDTAIGARDDGRRPTTSFGTMCVIRRVCREERTATQAVLVDSLLSGALDGTIRKALRDGGHNGEVLAASCADLVDSLGSSSPADARTKLRGLGLSKNRSAIGAYEVGMFPRGAMVAAPGAVPNAPFLECIPTDDAIENHRSIVYDIETGVHTFIANGLLVHNCDECLDLDGARASVPDGVFMGADGTDGGTGPGLHPRCRCTVIVVEKGSERIPRARPNAA